MQTKSRPLNLLLVDDDQHLAQSMGQWLASQGFEVYLAVSKRQALSLLHQHAFDLALVDLRLPDGDGFEVLQFCRQQKLPTTILLMTGYATVETGIEAMRAGAFDLLTKPLIDEELLISLRRALSQREILQENRQLKTQLENRFGMKNIVGNDRQMQKVFETIGCIADTKATVLITGESGTGKSLIARAIHRQSDRKDGPFVEVDCGALSETLLESELFGHVAGAFTGAIGNKEGKFKQAHGGTIFLDEIGTATPGLQVKLLRVLQEFQFEQVGGTKTFSVDTRVILATNEDLATAVAQGRFRQDLYYRINVINLEIPPLRQRVSDIEALADNFLINVCKETGREVRGFDLQALQALQSYHWPGNVRELQNAVERAVLLCKGECLGVNDLPTHIAAGAGIAIRANVGTKQTLKEALEEPERQIIMRVLKENSWNRNLTAEQLGINRTTLYKKMKRLGLDDQYANLLN
ncbi:MAG TPA: sigma-54 dependent transcriptional regulator [Pirellulaceae bacterium]|nr:sigma-54 dependent transcriptional regulator [Pirellulaceae bacterium]HMO90828.1 sigma-54 dependent transcriptional regulator [Pirellulaceae bacterium]HMP68079.1 sigma-54 dependent transcriptional regulator [Pirellulaceae bacterium]